MLCEPRVHSGRFCRNTVRRVALEKLSDDVLCFGRNVGPMVIGKENALIDLGKQIATFVGSLHLPREGRPSAQEDVHDDATAPQIQQLDLLLRGDEGRDAAVAGIDGGDDLRRDVESSATRRVLDVGARGLADDLGQAVVSETDVVPVVDEDVLELDVAVHDVDVVEIRDGGEELLHDLRALHLVELAAAPDGEFEEVALHEFHDHVDLRRRGDALVELQNVGVARAAENFLLVGEHRHDLSVVEVCHGHDFDGAFFVLAALLDAGDDAGEGAGADLIVVVDVVEFADVASGNGGSGWDFGDGRRNLIVVGSHFCVVLLLKSDVNFCFFQKINPVLLTQFWYQFLVFQNAITIIFRTTTKKKIKSEMNVVFFFFFANKIKNSYY